MTSPDALRALAAVGNLAGVLGSAEQEEFAAAQEVSSLEFALDQARGRLAYAKDQVTRCRAALAEAQAQKEPDANS